MAFPELFKKCSKNLVSPLEIPQNLLKISKNPRTLKNWVTCSENSMALVGFLLAPSVSAESTSSAEPAILKSLTARNAGLWVKLLTDTVTVTVALKHCKQRLQASGYESHQAVLVL